MTRWIRRGLRSALSARTLASICWSASFLSAALAFAFATVWSDVIARDNVDPAGGGLLPLTTIVLFLYSSGVFALVAACIAGRFGVRAFLARIFGEHWKRSAALGGFALLLSVLYFVVTFAASHVEFAGVVAERPIYMRARVFGFPLIVPRIDVTREDGLTAFMLLTSGCLAAAMFIALSLSARDGRVLPRELWGALALGFLILAMDEVFDIHRIIGVNAPLLRRMSIHDEPGMFVLGAYAAGGIAVLLAYLRELRTNRWGFVALLTGAVFQLLAMLVGPWAWRKEEAFEVAEAVMLFIGIISFAMDEIEAYYRTSPQ